MTQCGLAKCAKFVAHKTARPIPVEISALPIFKPPGLTALFSQNGLRLTELKPQRGADPSMANVSALVGWGGGSSAKGARVSTMSRLLLLFGFWL
jgi:hypothetical protein